MSNVSKTIYFAAFVVAIGVSVAGYRSGGSPLSVALSEKAPVQIAAAPAVSSSPAPVLALPVVKARSLDQWKTKYRSLSNDQLDAELTTVDEFLAQVALLEEPGAESPETVEAIRNSIRQKAVITQLKAWRRLAAYKQKLARRTHENSN